MKKYVFITMNISGINGAEQYIYNKMNYLKANGYQVLVFSGRPGKILIDGFREHEELIHPALRFFPYYLSGYEYKKVVAWICSVIDIKAGDTCIVESSNVISALWGEVIAKKLGCRHLAIILTENRKYAQDKSVQDTRSFLEFKLQRHELSGIFDDSVSKMLGKKDLPFRPDMRVRAYCNNVVQDCEDRFSHLLNPSADYTLGSIGRLEKDYVPALMEQLMTYFASHSDKKYNLLLIGGCADKRKLKRIKKTFAKCSNVTLVMTGNLYPIPRTLVRKADLFISASGSSAVSYYENVPSVRVHHLTAEPLGIFGYDIGTAAHSAVPEKRSLHDCIDQIIKETLEISYIDDFEKTYYEKMHTEFARQLQFGEEQEIGGYYDALSVQNASRMYRWYRIVCRIFGVRFTYGLLECVRKLVRGSGGE